MRRFRFAALLLLIACGAGAETGQRLLDDLAADGGPTPLKAEAPQVVRRAAPNGGDIYQAYETGGMPILLLGRFGRPLDERRLATIAQSLARAHFDVLVPAEPGSFLPMGESEEEIVSAIDSLSGKIVVIAISLSVAPALRAAHSRPDKIAGFVAIGATDDVAARWRELSRRSPSSAWRDLALVFEAAAPQRDRVLLSGIAARKAQNPDAAIDDLKGQLSPEGLEFLAIGETQGSELPDLAKRVFDGLSPPRGGPSWPMLILNGADDAFAPSPEPLAQILAAPPEQVLQLEVLAGFGKTKMSLRDRRVWLRGISVLLDWARETGPPRR